MQERHRAGHHRAAPCGQAAALHEVVTLTQALHEPRDLEEVVAVVGIAHDDEPAARGVDAGHQRVAVALVRHMDDTRAVPLGDGHRPIFAAVVGNNHFAVDA